MAESEMVEMKESAPSLYLRDEHIEKYAGKGFDSFKIGDIVDAGIKFKVVGVSKRKEGDKERRSVDLELVGRGDKNDSNIDKAIKTMGNKADY